MIVVDLSAYDPVTGMCTATTPLPHRHEYCQLPFAHEGDHQWADEYQPTPEVAR